MRKIPVEQAVGETLCHDMTAILENGFKGVRFARGHVIAPEDIPEFKNMGKYNVFVWEPEADEVHEDDAGLAITQAVCGPGVQYTGPYEGKFQLTAAVDGLFRVNGGALRSINCVEDYTIASRPDRTPVQKGEKLAGARIVPLVTRRANVDMAVNIANHQAPVFTVLPYLPLKVGIVIIGSEVYYGRIKDKFEGVMRKKLPRYGADMLGFIKCPDDLVMIRAAISSFREQAADLILLTGGMSVDPDDLTPTAIRESGAQIVTRGVPMQPGNMLMMAYLEKTMLIGVPGASLHSDITSLDIFLPRVFTGERIHKEDIAGLGEGGLCMGCKVCRYPVCFFGRK